MKSTVTLLLALVFVIPAFADDDPMLTPTVPVATIDRVAALNQDIIALTLDNAEVAKFTTLLDEAKTKQGDVAARQKAFDDRGDVLKKEFVPILAESKAYTVDRKAHDARCPESTTDATLAADCDAEFQRLEARRLVLKKHVGDWTTEKNVLFADLQQFDADNAAVKRCLDSLIALEKAKKKVIMGLQAISNAIYDCRQAITGSTEEDMVEKCGQMWDGNLIHPGLVKTGTGTRFFNQ